MNVMWRAALVASVLAVSACGPNNKIEEDIPVSEPAPELKTYPAAASAKEAYGLRVAAKDAVGEAIFLQDAVKASGDGRQCRAIRKWESQGPIPANAKPASLRQYAGAEAISIHCAVRAGPSELVEGQYMVILPGDKPEPIILDCIPPGGKSADDNICWWRWEDR